MKDCYKYSTCVIYLLNTHNPYSPGEMRYTCKQNTVCESQIDLFYSARVIQDLVNKHSGFTVKAVPLPHADL